MRVSLSFREKVYKICRLIPKGKVATYGQIARLAGRSKAARSIGLFMKTNPDPPIIPCHRIVGFDGNLTGYSASGGISRKKQLLKSEGVIFNKNVVNLTYSLWKK